MVYAGSVFAGGQLCLRSQAACLLADGIENGLWAGGGLGSEKKHVTITNLLFMSSLPGRANAE